MIKFTINRERCKACGLCIVHCPKEILKEGEDFNDAGYHPIVQDEPESCTGCGLCAVMCPEACFEIRKVEEAAK